MKRRPQLLFLCQTLPFPPDGGVKIRSYNVLRLLAREFDVTALCFYRWKGGTLHTNVEADLKGLRALAEVEAFPIPQEHARWRLVWDHVRSVCRGRVYTACTYESSGFRKRLVEVLGSRRFDLVHLDSLDLSAYLPMIRDTPVVCVHHNIESTLLRRRSEFESGRWRRAYLLHQATLMEREERRWCPQVAMNIAVSPVDRCALERLAPGARCAVVPNGVDTRAFRPRPSADAGIVFVGGTSWFPNRDALHYFCNEILPLIPGAGKSVPVRWVGRAREHERAEVRKRYGVEVTGYVEDIRPFVSQAACYVVPLRVGGGTRLKILDAWAMGKAVVSTSIGCEGLEAIDGESILIRDTPAGFAEAVQQILGDRQLRERLGRNARATAELAYSWDVIGKTMNEIYLDLARAPQPRVRTTTSAP